jgi:hypothetical protein
MMKGNRIVPTVLVFALLSGCGGSDSASNTIPPQAAAMVSKLKSGMARSVQRLAGYEASLVFVLNPGSPLSSNISLAPDNTLGAPPFSYVFSGPFDGNQDGYEETTLNGKASQSNAAVSGVTYTDTAGKMTSLPNKQRQAELRQRRKHS